MAGQAAAPAAPAGPASPGGPRPLTIRDYIAQEATTLGIPSSLALAMVDQESKGQQSKDGQPVVSPKGAVGFFQLMTPTARDLGVNALDPFENIRGGLTYFKQQLDTNKGDVRLALAAYNAGPARVAAAGGRVPGIPETQDYVQKILAGWQQAGQAAPSTPGGVQAPPVAAPGAAPATAPVRSRGAGPAAPPTGPSTGRATGAGPGPPQQAFSATPETDLPTPMGVLRSIGEPFDPRTSEGRQNLAATAAEVGVSFIPGVGPALRPAIGALAKTSRLATFGRHVVAPAVAAGIGGGTEAAIEQTISPPPSTAITLPVGTGLGDLLATEPPDSPTRVAVTQSLYSVGGQIALLPIRGTIKMLLASSVGKAATAGVEEAVTHARDVGKAARAAIRDKVNEGMSAARIVMNAADKTRAAVINRTLTPAAGESAIRATAARIPGAAAAQAQQELENVAALGAATRELDNLLPPSIEATVEAQRRVLAGPAKVALDQAGARVDEAARSGPMVSMGGVQSAIHEMIDRETLAFEREAAEAAAGVPAMVPVTRIVRKGDPLTSSQPTTWFHTGHLDDARAAQVNDMYARGTGQVVRGYLPRNLYETAATKLNTDEFGNAIFDAPSGAVSAAFSTKLPTRVTGTAPAVAAGVGGATETISREEYQRIMTEQLHAPADSPLPKTLAKIMSAPEEISFHDAHLLKRDLDEHVRWDAVAKKRMEQWTKGARIAIREEMSGHTPYDIATAAYEGLIPLYRRGVGKKLATALTNNPDEAARLLVERSPIRAQMLKDLLLTQSAAGGDPAAGKLAWDLVRSSYTYDHLIKGNPLKLGERVTTLLRDHPEFVKVIADDPAGQGVLDNLVRIGTAITDAEARAVEKSATTRVAQKVAGHEAIRETAERTQAATRAAEATRERLKGTSLRSLETAAGEAAAGIALGPKSWFGARYILRTIKGTRSDDILEWAAYSPVNTQRLTQALLGPIPDRAMSILLRDMLGGSSPLPPPTVIGTPQASAVARNQPQP
ncbi:MAG: lytic transglycosylase domain-containing protein [Pseudomonadota bacterium]